MKRTIAFAPLLRLFALGVLISGGAQAAPLQKLTGIVQSVPSGGQNIGPLEAKTVLDLTITLRPKNEEALDALVRDVQDPSSPRFRHFVTAEEFEHQFAPDAESIAKVKAFARTKGLLVVDDTEGTQTLHLRGAARAVASAMHVQIRRYRLAGGAMGYAATGDPSLDLAVPILYVGGLSDIPAQPKKPPPVFHPDNSGGTPIPGIAGAAIRARYAAGSPRTGKGQTVAILSVDSYDLSDIQGYAKANGAGPIDVSDRIVGQAPTGPMSLETALDIEMVSTMAPDAKILVYRYQDVHAVLEAIAKDNLAAQVSTSVSLIYDAAVYASLKRLAAQGQTFFSFSGDFGSWDEKNGKGDFPPADHPLVTSVGGTRAVLDQNGKWTSEAAWQGSGGGYSPWTPDPQFALPPWQVGMNLASIGGSNITRNAPDVSALADDVSIDFKGQFGTVGGTSASTPIWAGFMALANEQLQSIGGHRLGPINPAVYAIQRNKSCPTCFTDIVSGNNFNTTNPTHYSAAAGYDLVTGWGSPAGAPLIEALVTFEHPAPPPPIPCADLKRDIAIQQTIVAHDIDYPPACPSKIVALCAQKLRADESVLAQMKADYAKRCLH